MNKKNYNRISKSIDTILITLALILFALLLLTYDANANDNKQAIIFTNTQCGVACVDVKEAFYKTKVMIFTQEGYIKMNSYINPGMNKIDTSNLEPGMYYIVVYVNDVYVDKDTFTIGENI